MRTALFFVALLVAGIARAEPDTFGLGTGRSGPLRVDAPNTLINRYVELSASVAAGARDLVVSDSTGFTPGELVLVHQSTGLTPEPDSGNQKPVSLLSGTVGRFEYARVEAVSVGGLRLTAPLLYGYPAPGTQVVSVPEFTSVQVLAGASLRAAPWDGRVGGILAFLATGTLSNEGLLSVEGVGFRGGVFQNHAALFDCPATASLSQANGGSSKGEGLVLGRFETASGRGNLANGGGGGNCHNSGGGGGGHFGLGGQGGFSNDGDGSRDVGGLGGAPLVYLPYERLVFGGGGGAGEGDDELGSSGGAGGGLMLLRAAAVTGAGRFSAKGAAALPTVAPGDDGAGGGGAGGALSVWVALGLACGGAEASGGAGGDAIHPSILTAPGGGGGGGVVFLQGSSISCSTAVLAGPPGTSVAAGNSRGAGPTNLDGGNSYGLEQTLELPFRVPTTPVLAEPVNGATGVAPRPRFSGKAEPGVRVQLFLDGVLYREVAAGDQGDFSLSAFPDLAPGRHEVRVSSEVLGIRSPLSEATVFDVTVPVSDGGVPDGGTGTPDAGTDSPDGGTGTPDGGGEVPARPVVVVPLEGEVVDPTPVLAGTSPGAAAVSLEVDEVEVAQVPVDEEGRFRYVLTDAQALMPGAHHLTAHALDGTNARGLASQMTNFEVAAPTALDVSCGCGASPGAGAGAVALLLGAWAARRRRKE